MISFGLIDLLLIILLLATFFSAFRTHTILPFVIMLMIVILIELERFARLVDCHAKHDTRHRFYQRGAASRPNFPDSHYSIAALDFWSLVEGPCEGKLIAISWTMMETRPLFPNQWVKMYISIWAIWV